MDNSGRKFDNKSRVKIYATEAKGLKVRDGLDYSLLSIHKKHINSKTHKKSMHRITALNYQGLTRG